MGISEMVGQMAESIFSTGSNRPERMTYEMDEPGLMQRKLGIPLTPKLTSRDL
jgi:hypothetical protein